MRRILCCGLFVLMSAIGADAQQVSKTQTARIWGRVVSDAGAPVRGADVALSGDHIRQTVTDDQGRYEFTALPAGRFYLNANKPGFATPISTFTSRSLPALFQLADGQELNRTITLTRGGVITGRLVDEFGEPITGAEMRVERYTYGPGGRYLAQHSAGLAAAWITNDLGEYRVFALAPGEYLVSARTRQFGSQLTMGSGGAGDRAEGWLPTYYPGTTRAAEAQAVRVVAGRETVVDFSAVPGRLVRISGTVTSATGRSVSGLNVFLGVRTSNSSGPISGGGIAADGSFSMGNVPPGDYILEVRQQGGGARGTEEGSMPLSVSTQDLTDLRLTTRPGATIRGRVEWAGNSPRPTSPMRVSTRSADWSLAPLGGESTITYLDLENGTVRDDGTFELGGIVGNVLFNAGAQAWSLKSVTFTGRDITNTGIDAASLEGDERVVIVMTDVATNLSGTAQDAARRQPVTDYTVVVLPQQAITGMAAMRYTRVLLSDESGGFQVRGLPAGEYVAAAVETLESGREWDPDVQKTLRTNGRRFTLTDGETLTLNLDLLR
jgi:hypothetical protein